MLVHTGNHTHLAFEAAAENETLSDELYPEAWKNMTLNVTSYISDEIGDFWHYCATSGWEWYNVVLEYIIPFESIEVYIWPISAL